MWAQMVKVRVKEGSEQRLQGFQDRWEREVGRGTDSGWRSARIYRSEKDPRAYYILVTFESEEAARRNEQSQQHQATLADFAGLMEGEPEYVDLVPVHEASA